MWNVQKTRLTSSLFVSQASLINKMTRHKWNLSFSASDFPFFSGDRSHYNIVFHKLPNKEISALKIRRISRKSEIPKKKNETLNATLYDRVGPLREDNSCPRVAARGRGQKILKHSLIWGRGQIVAARRTSGDDGGNRVWPFLANCCSLIEFFALRSAF